MAAPIDLDPFDYDFHDDPYPLYGRLREEAPFYRNEELGFVALSRHADVLAGFKDHARLCNSQGISLEMNDLTEEAAAVLGEKVEIGHQATPHSGASEIGCARSGSLRLAGGSPAAPDESLDSH